MLGIYSRQSTDKQKSIPFQMELGEKFANENNLPFIHYSEKGVSGGAPIQERKEFQRLLDDIAKGKVTKVFVWEQDRAEREPLTWFTLCYAIDQSDAELYENGILVDLQDPGVFMIRGIKSIMNRGERIKSAMKSKQKLHSLAEKGFVHGVMPYGYQKDDNNRMVREPKESAIVRMIFNWSLEGDGYTTIAHRLNEMGILTRYNKYGGTYEVDINRNNALDGKVIVKNKEETKWVHGTIKNILFNRTYIGERVYAGIPMKVDPIVQEEIFNEVHRRIGVRANKTGKKTYHKYLMNNYVFCSKCGKRYTGREVNNHFYYRCVSRIRKGSSCGNNGVRMKEFDSFIWEALIERKELEKQVEVHFNNNDVADKKRTLRREIEETEKKINVLEKKRSRIISAWVDGLLSEEDLKSDKFRVERELADMRAIRANKMETLNSYVDEKKVIRDMKNDIVLTIDGKKEKYIFEPSKRLKYGKEPFESKRDFLQKWIGEILIDHKGSHFEISIKTKVPDMDTLVLRLNDDYKNGYLSNGHQIWP